MTPDIDYQAVLPLLVVLGAAIVSVLVEAFVPARARYVTQVALYLGGLGVALVSVLVLAGTRLVTASGAVAVDGPTLFLQGATVIVALGAGPLIGERRRAGPGDASGRVDAVSAASSSSSSGARSGTSRGPVLAGFAPQAALAPGGDNERAAERAGVTQTEVFPLVLFATGGLMLFPAANDQIGRAHV